MGSLTCELIGYDVSVFTLAIYIESSPKTVISLSSIVVIMLTTYSLLKEAKTHSLCIGMQQQQRGSAKAPVRYRVVRVELNLHETDSTT